MTDKQLPPLPTPKFTETIRGVPCITVTEHEHLMREYALQAIAHATQPAGVTLPHLWPVIRWLKNGCDVADAITELELYERHIEKARAILALRPVQVPMTDREIELIDGMIAVQLDHAQRCDAISNRVMAEKQKGWDMERVELLRRFRAYGITAQAKKEAP